MNFSCFFDFVYSSARFGNSLSAFGLVVVADAFEFSTDVASSSQASSCTSVISSDAFFGIWFILASLRKFSSACTCIQYSFSEFNFSLSDIFSCFNSALFINLSLSTLSYCSSFGECGQ